MFLAGATAVGKSEIALQLAERIGGEIISVDSMQVYRGLDIGTAKPSREEQQRVRHHLIDVAELHESFDAARFVILAKAAVAEIHARGKVPIFCGGTGLYFKAFLDGLGEAPPSDPLLRFQLESTPLAELLQELQQRDPVTYDKIDRQNPRRVVRALEVIRLTGKPFSAQRAAWKTSPHPNLFGVSRATSELVERIDRRVDDMFKQGLVAETKSLLQAGLEQNRTAMQAIGYKQVVEHLRAERSLPETIELVKIRTRQFAKRQLTWFRRQMHLRWLNGMDDPVATIVNSISV
ncbi:MAG: tRNA (adenosine(37)-N6)-dimethylallyltransferase MiaA [Limisphaerales bacterium]